MVGILENIQKNNINKSYYIVNGIINTVMYISISSGTSGISSGTSGTSGISSGTVKILRRNV